jgi:glucose/arabinose dehydrogenase
MRIAIQAEMPRTIAFFQGRRVSHRGTSPAVAAFALLLTLSAGTTARAGNPAQSGAGTPVQPSAGTPGPTLTDANLTVRSALTGLNFPTSLAFLGDNDMLLLEKNTGKVQHFANGAMTTVLDLAVNSASERGLLGIVLDPSFATNHFVYLYWTNRAPAPSDPFTPSLTEGPDQPEMGDDTDDVLAVPLLGNRIDRFVWNGSALVFDRNLIKLHAFQNDAAPTPPNQGDSAQPARGNHNGGAMRFGPDGKLYLFFGDNGRRGPGALWADRTWPPARRPPAWAPSSPTISSGGRRRTTPTSPASSCG